MKEFLLRANITLFFMVGVCAHSTLQCNPYNKEDPNYLRKYIASKCLERYTPSCQSFCDDPIDRFIEYQERNSTNNGIICCLAGCGIPLLVLLMFASCFVVKCNFSPVI